MKQAVTECKVVRLATAQGSASADFNGNVLDMQGYDGVMLIGCIGTGNAANGLKAQGGAQSDGSDAVDLEGSLVESDANATTMVLDVFRPRERYVRPVIVRGANTTIDSVVAVLYNGRTCPVDNSEADEQNAKLVVSPAEGVA